jgi:uncharacterized protein YvpB
MSFTGCLKDEKPDSDTQKYSTKTESRIRTESSSSASSDTAGNKAVLLDAPIISQKPELSSGCEVTSLAMLLQYAGVKVDKMTLAQNIKKDETLIAFDENGNITRWGNPNDGFVGDITGQNEGFAVYPKPMLQLMEQYLPGKSVNLTSHPFETLLKSIEQGRPVIVWVTVDFQYPDKYEEWKKNDVIIRATLEEHAVLLVGYDQNYCYINNPYNGIKNQAINKDTFAYIWNTMCSMAITYN